MRLGSKIIFLLSVLLPGTRAEAHDFWVQPGDYWIEPDAATPITLQVGHGPLRQRSPIRPNRIVRFEAFGPDGASLDLRKDLHLGSTLEDGSLRLQTPGGYVVVLETDNRAQSHLPALRFNDYLRVEGLTAVLRQRERTHRMESDGSESYSRHAKLMMQVGAPGAGSQARITRPLGLPLEIVPEVNPYAEPRPAQLPVRVMFEGQPLSGALVKLTNLEHDEEPLEMHLTDSAGGASFTLPTRGIWLLNVIWSKPLPADRETNFETRFASLTFGFPRS
jgi:uncharacterized GH25 family protein